MNLKIAQHKYFFILLLSVVSFNETFSQNKEFKRNKLDTIHIVGHQHMDMNWLWTTDETMKMSQDNLRQTIAFMEEFPDFTLIQSQIAHYKFVEEQDPQLFEKIKKYVAEGRLELGGGMWTQGDMNMSSGEAITRSFLLGQQYYQSRFGKTANVGWLPDTFGHISQFPQILKLAGCDYFYFRRCRPYLGSFWWQAPNGSVVQAYSNESYNGKIRDDIKTDLDRIHPNKRRIFQPTGVGDHGGGPTRNMIKKIHQLDQKKDHPAVKFTTAEYFFKQMEKDMDDQPTHIGEMQYTLEGCYTSVARIKEGNRNAETNLFSAEYLSSLNWLNGNPYPSNALNDIWEMVVFNQFHDILPGSGIHEANAEAIAEYYRVNKNAREVRDQAFRSVVDEIQFKTGLGQPIVAINHQPFNRSHLVTGEIFIYDKPKTARVMSWQRYYQFDSIRPVDIGQGKFPSVLVSDGEGNTYPAQIVWGKKFPPGYRIKVQFMADIKPGGYKTFYIDPYRPSKSNYGIVKSGFDFETDFFSISIDPKSGEIIRLKHKRTNKEYTNGQAIHQHKIYLEKPHGIRQKDENLKHPRTDAWNIGKIIDQQVITEVRNVRIVENGPVRACIKVEKYWGNSKIVQKTFIYKSYPRIDYELEVHWLEHSDDFKPSPMLRAVFPISMDDVRFSSHVPFDVIDREVNGQEVPAQRWVDITDGEYGIALLNKTKYGHSYQDGELRLSLLRSPGSPDQYPNMGKFKIEYALFPHTGDWKNGVLEEGDVFNVPAYAAEPPSQSLKKEDVYKPEERAGLSINGKGVVLSGIKKAENTDELIIRLFEAHGNEQKVEISLPYKIESVRLVDLAERAIEQGEISLKNNQINLKIKPHEIVSLAVSVARE
jgi:alpha-mannosidase